MVDGYIEVFIGGFVVDNGIGVYLCILFLELGVKIGFEVSLFGGI